MNWMKGAVGTLALLVLIGFCLLPYAVQATENLPDGNCGDGLTWTLDLDGTLVISGTGSMTNFGPSYAENVSVPWADNRADIRTVVIENGVTSIGNNAFVACSNFTKITIADSVTRIGEHAFQNCLNLATVDIPDAVTEIGEYAFAGCRALSSIAIPEGVTAIAGYTFESCVGLTNVVIPEGVTVIGRNAFKYCPSLTEIMLPESITSIGRDAFEECENLGHILYTGTQEQWAAVTVRSGALPDRTGITYEYVDGMDYHVFDSDCDDTCSCCPFTRDALHTWDDGVTNADTTLTFTCTVCGDTRVEGTPVVPTVPTQPTEPSQPVITTEPTAPAIQPSSPNASAPSDNGGAVPVMIIVAVLAAGVGIALLTVKKKS